MAAEYSGPGDVAQERLEAVRPYCDTGIPLAAMASVVHVFQ
jgi:hypothetical protein